MMRATQQRLVEVGRGEVEPVARRSVGVDEAFRAYGLNQGLLMARSIEDWVPEGYLARFVSGLVDDALDLSAVYAAYEQERGFSLSVRRPAPGLSGDHASGGAISMRRSATSPTARHRAADARVRHLTARFDMSLPDNQRKLDVVQALARVAEDARLSEIS